MTKDNTEELIKVTRERDNWIESARQFSNNADYYRELLVQIGATLGKEAYTQDDGGIVDEPLVSKCPELVAALMTEKARLEAQLEESDAALISAICKEPPCMYGSNERVYIMAIIEAARKDRARQKSSDAGYQPVSAGDAAGSKRSEG